MDLDVHVRTYCNYLNSSGLLKFEMIKRAPALNDHHKERRLYWAKEMVNYNEKCEHVTFSNGPDGYKFYCMILEKKKSSLKQKTSVGLYLNGSLEK